MLHFLIGTYIRDNQTTAASAAAIGAYNAEAELSVVNHFILAGKEAEAATLIDECVQKPELPPLVRTDFELLRRRLPSFGIEGELIKAKSLKMQVGDRRCSRGGLLSKLGGAFLAGRAASILHHQGPGCVLLRECQGEGKGRQGTPWPLAHGLATCINAWL